MENKIAIVGVAARFPEAQNIQALHRNLREGRNSMNPISEKRLKATTLPSEGEYIVKGYMEDIDLFDYKYFNYSLAEAQTMDPHQRFLLEVVQETFDNAGYNLETLSGSNTAVYVANRPLSYYKHATEFVPTLVTGNGSEFLAARISRFYNLTGSVAVIDTSCSSSLVALHNACNELILENADQAIVCGVNIELFPFLKTENYVQEIISPDGRSIPFSSQANGMANGEVAACVMLKPLSAAQRDNDIIHAVITGTAVNNNANRSAGITSPDSVAQADVMQKAWKKANISPLDLGFIETHGSGTQLGDSIEVGGLNLAFREFTEAKQVCPIATIKSNIGHARSAAGIAGLVKTIVSLKNKEIYPSYYTGIPSVHIDFDNAAVYVNETLKPWEVATDKKRMAGVSSLGFSGTNAHVVVEEAPVNTKSNNLLSSENHIVTISSKNLEGLINNAKALLERLENDQEICLQDLAFTLATGRNHFNNRVAFNVKSISALMNCLEEFIENPAIPQAKYTKTTFIFSNQKGCKEADLKAWSNRYPVFNSYADQCDNILKSLGANMADCCEFVFQYGYYQTLNAFGLKPDSTVGIGMGKIVVDVITQKITLNEGIKEALIFEEKPILNIEQRVQSLINRETEKGNCLFIELGKTSQISKAFLENSDCGNTFDMYALTDSFETDISKLLKISYLSNKKIEWTAFFKGTNAQKIELPAYQFAKTRCWIRETPTYLAEFKASIKSTGKEDNLEAAPKKETLTDLQKSVLELWQDLIGDKVSGLDNHFFEIGGNSLQATKIINRVNKAFNIRLSFEDMFDYPIMRDFCALVEKTIPFEQIMLMMWKQVLKMEDLSLDDDFFDVGGHSLLANQVLARLKNNYNVVVDFDEFFDYPTARTMAAYIEETHLKKVSKNVVQPSINQVVKSVEIQEQIGIFDASNAQKRLWLLNLMDTESIAYNESSVFVIEGNLNSEALKKSFEEIVSRHQILRTVFKNINGEPKQEILAFKDCFYQFESTKVAEESAAKPVIEAFVGTPFDLEKSSLIRTKLVQISSERHLLLFNIHHIVFDEWSFRVLMGELAALYEAFSRDKASTLKPLNIQYKDYTKSINNKMQSADFEECKKYWLEKFNDGGTTLELPTDYARPAVKTFNGTTFKKTIVSNQWKEIQALSRQYNATVFSVFSTAVNALLYHYTGQQDVVIGMPVAGREEVEYENQIGYYANTVALRTVLSENESFGSLLEKCRNTILEAQKYQLYPFDTLREDLNLKIDSSRSPLFDVMILFDKRNGDYDGIALNQITIKGYGQERSTSKFDLTFAFFVSANNEVTLSLNYNSDLFRPETIERMAQHLENFLTAILQNTEAQISEIEYLSEHEKATLLNEFASSEAWEYNPATLHEMFSKSVAQNPDSLALYWQNESISYAQLNENSNKIANYLLNTCQVQPNDFVGLLMERSPDMIAAIFGILKTGAAYVPILTTFPEERINYIINDSKVKLVISDELKNQDVVVFQGIISKTDATEICVQNDSESIACVLYTSGSSGKPKGVLVQHKGLVNIADWMWNAFGLTKADTLIQKANYIFDVSAREIFTSLCKGAKLVIAPDNVLADANATAKTIEKYGVNSIHFTPTALNLFLDAVDNENLSGLDSLKHILCGGETITKELLEKYYSKLSIPFVNEYGPTEASVTSTYKIIEPKTSMVSIGKALQGNWVYVLDKNLNVCPIGVWGEICLAGIGTAKGYLNNEQQTNEKFVANRYATNEFNKIIYRTGDIARFLPDGSLEFKGRVDSQVKINGYRVELGEIENALINHQGINEVAVVINQNHNQEKVITAYWVASETRCTEQQIRRDMAEKLPTFMIPHFFILLAKLPQTPTGKIDRQALSRVIVAQEEMTFKNPSNALEATILGIWQKVLVKEDISLNDNFFTIGGHSLKATRVIAGIQQVTGFEINLRDFFANPTIEALAKMSQVQEVSNAIIPTEKRAFYELSNAERRLWVLSHLNESSAAYHIKATFEIEGNLNENVFTDSFKTLVNLHESLRTNFIEIEGIPRQVVHDSIDFEIEKMDFSNLQAGNEKAEEWLQTQQPIQFDLTAGALMKAYLLKIEVNKWLFDFTIHHIVSDEWSLGVMMNEIMNIYRANLNVSESNFTAPNIQYRDYVAWQEQQLQKSNIKPQADFWKKTYSIPVPVLELPTDFVRPANKTYNGAEVSISLDSTLTAQFDSLCQKTGTTPFMNLLASLNVLLFHYTGQNDLVIGTPIAGRQQVELENQIGNYINTLALRNSFDGTQSYKDFLTSLKENTLNAFDNQGYPFDKLVDDLQLKRDFSHSPLFDIMLVMNNTDIENVKFNQMEGLSISPLVRPVRFCKYDLTFFVKQQNDEIRISLNYNTDLFTQKRANLIMQQWQTLIVSIFKNPNLSIESLNYISEDEAKCFVVERNQKDVQSVDFQTIKDRFESQVLTTPTNIALIDKGKNITYDELNQRANQLASTLISRYNVGVGDTVGMRVSRSEKLIVSMLGIIKTGAAFLPMDVHFPTERINFLLEDSQAKVLVSDEFFTTETPLFLYETNEIFSEEQIENPNVKIKLTDVVYMIYTSGSTGKPKGTQIPNLGLANYVNWFKTTYQLTENDRNFLMSSIAFDLCFTSIWTSILTGGSVSLAPENQYPNMRELLHQVHEEKVTILKMTPAHLNLMINEPDFAQLSNDLKVRLVVLGGEKLKVRDLETFFEHKPQGVTFVDEYGPTETTIGVITKNIINDNDTQTFGTPISIFKQQPSIGYPIDNHQVYVLSNEQKLKGVGVWGELCIAGAGMAVGYLNQKALTDEKFIVNPFQPDQRLYLTGDIARWLPNGEIEYMGRKDGQVKIRGYRVEIGEVEHALNNHSIIENAIVKVQEDYSGVNKLIAFLMVNQAIELTILRNDLKVILPEYMIPSQFVIMSEFPMMGNGKVDRKLLITPDLTEEVLNDNYCSPETKEEKMMVAIIVSVLGRKQVGIYDDFFLMGGDSIKAIQITSRLYRLGYQMEVKDIFTNPVVANMIRYLKPIGRIIDQSAVSGSVNLTPIQAEFFDSSCPEPDFYVQSVMLKNDERIDGYVMTKVINQLITHHDALRMSFKSKKGVVTQQNRPESETNTEVSVFDLRQIEDSQNELKQLTKALRESINLKDDTLVKVAIFKMADVDYLFLVIHHLVIDGVSWRILLEDLDILYRQALQNQPFELPLKTDSFQYWSEQLTEYANSETFITQHEPYWQSVLNRVELETVKQTCSEDVGNETVIFDETLTHNLLTEAQKAYNTEINDLLLTALSMATYEVFGNDELLITLEGHGRESILPNINIQRTMAWFTSTYPVLLPANNRENLSTGIIEVKETLHKIPEKGIGFGILKYLTEGRKQVFESIQPKIIFNYLGQFDTDFSSDTFSLVPENQYLDAQSAFSWLSYPLTVTGFVVGGKLTFGFKYDKACFTDTIINRLSVVFKDSLHQIVEHCVSQHTQIATPSDFGFSDFSFQELESLFD